MSDRTIKVLVVDDDFATRLLACEALMAEGFETAEAEDGEDALRQLATTAADVVLVDVNMPGMNGYEVCRAIRGQPGGDTTSILVMTAGDDLEAVEQAFSSGATDFMTKPLNLPLLGRRVRFMQRAADAASAARDAARRLTRAQQLAHIVHWRMVDRRSFAWESDPYVALWPEAPANHPRLALIDLVHPHDYNALAAAMATRETLSVETRILLPDGSERTVRHYLEPSGDVLIGATQDITSARFAETQFEQLAFFDDLTGIPNRQFLTRYLAAQRGAKKHAAFTIELGKYRLPALVGSYARDLIVRAATSRVLERVRNDDVRLRLDQIPCAPEWFEGVTVVARISADELCVVTTAVEQAPAMLRQVCELFGRPFIIADQIVTLAPRFGFASYPDVVEEIQDLPDRARIAMQEAEPEPPRNVVVFGPIIAERRRHRDRLTYELGLELDAAEAGEPTALEVVYRRRAAGSVDLARAAPSWAPLAAEPALFDEISAGALANRLARWLVQRAREDVSAWRASGRSVRLAIPVPFRAITALVDVLQELTALPRDAVQIELTGPAPQGADRMAAIAQLEHLRAHGIGLVRADVDANTPIAEIVGMPLDGVCIAMAMIAAMPPAVIQAFVTGCRALHLTVGVSGVASPVHQLLLEDLDITEVSGPLLGDFIAVVPPPAPPDVGFEIRFRPA